MIENNMASDEERVKAVASSIPKIEDIRGKTVPKIGTYYQLNEKEQVVALIDEVCRSHRIV